MIAIFSSNLALTYSLIHSPSQQSNDLIHHLQTAAFVAIDEEMTGIQVPTASRKPTRKDLPPKVTYPLLKQAPERYSIIQLGVSLFHCEVPAQDKTFGASDDEDDEEEEGHVVEVEPDSPHAEAAAAEDEAMDPKPQPKWTVRSYNFYVFPSASARWDDAAAAATRELVLNPSTVCFLNEHNMSFDQWTKEGVNYVTRDRAEQIIGEYVTKHEQDKARGRDVKSPRSVEQTLRRKVELTRTEDVRFFASTMATLREWLDNAAGTNQSPQTMLLPSCNAFLRRALYENIEKEYPDLVLENGGGGHIRVLRLSHAEKLQREQDLKREAWSKMILNVGMWRVFDALSRACRGVPLSLQSPLFAPSYDDVDFALDAESPWRTRRVPLVVHNGFMDILFLMTHFDGPTLPESLSECKALVSSYFPVIYDTKVVSTEHTSTWSNDQNNLANLYNSVVRENPHLFTSIKNLDLGGPNDTQQEHEAAYDAFMTGSIYVGLCQHIALERVKREVGQAPFVGDLWHLQGDSEEVIALDCDQREYFGRNKIYQMSMFTLDLQDTESDGLKRGMLASASYHVSGIDPSVTTRDIVRCCSDLTDASGRKIEFNIIWVDNITFIVAATLRPPEDTEEDHSGRSEVTILSEHGEVLRNALKSRFSNQETIVSLEEHFNSQDGVAEDPSPWYRRAIDHVASLLGYPPKRKADEDDEAAPVAKRRRYN